MENTEYYLDNILRQERITNNKLSDLVLQVESGDRIITQAVREVNITNTALLMVMAILLIYNFIVRCLK